MSRGNAILFFIVIIAIVSIVPAAMHAQESTEEPTLVATDPAPEVTAIPTLPPVEEPPPVEPPPEETPVTTPSELLGQLFSLLKDGVYIVWASAGVVVIVGLLKSIFHFSGATATYVTLAVEVLIWIGYAIANFYGAGESFRAGYLILVDIARSLLPLFGTLFGAHVLYKAAAKRSVPIAGYRVPEKIYKSALTPPS